MVMVMPGSMVILVGVGFHGDLVGLAGVEPTFRAALC